MKYNNYIKMLKANSYNEDNYKGNLWLGITEHHLFSRFVILHC